MPLFPEHAPRRRLLDVAELLGEQVVKLDKAQGNVTPDEYRKAQEERMAQSKAFAEEQSKKYPTKPPAPPPKEFGRNIAGFNLPTLKDLKDPEFYDAAAKVPGKLASGAAAGAAEKGILSDEDAWKARRIAEAISPIDLSEKATVGSQAIGTAASLAGARLLTMLNNLRKLKGASKAAHDTAKARSAAKAEADRILGGKKPFYSDPKRLKPAAGRADDILGLPGVESATGAIGGAVASPAARSSFLGGLKSAIADGLRTRAGFWPKMAGATGLGGTLGYLAWQNMPSIWQRTGEIAGLASAIANRPPDVPTAKRNEAPGPASPVEKPKPADVRDELRAADKEWIDPRHGGARGVDEQGFPVKILPRPSEKDLANVRGGAAEESLRNDAGFAKARAAYMRLKNKVRILNDRRIPLEAGLTPFELRDWNTFNAAHLMTPSGLSIYDPEAARDAK
jgi:hypothetical protein